MKSSLAKNGLEAVGSIACPKGGNHAVVDLDLIAAKKRGSGQAVCEKCGQAVELRAV